MFHFLCILEKNYNFHTFLNNGKSQREGGQWADYYTTLVPKIFVNVFLFIELTILGTLNAFLLTDSLKMSKRFN